MGPGLRSAKPQGEGDTLMFSYIRRLGSFFECSKFDFEHFFFFFGGGGGQKNKYFGGTRILWIFFGVITNWTIFRGHFYAL